MKRVSRVADQEGAFKDMTNSGVPVKLSTGQEVRIRAKSMGYMELIVFEIAGIVESAGQIGKVSDQIPNMSIEDLGPIVRRLTVGTTAGMIRITQLILQDTPRPPTMDADIEWSMSEDDIKWVLTGDDIASILTVFLKVQWGWAERVKNFMSQAVEKKSKKA